MVEENNVDLSAKMDEGQQFRYSYDGSDNKSLENLGHQSTSQEKGVSTLENANVGQDLAQP